MSIMRLVPSSPLTDKRAAQCGIKTGSSFSTVSSRYMVGPDSLWFASSLSASLIELSRDTALDGPFELAVNWAINVFVYDTPPREPYPPMLSSDVSPKDSEQTNVRKVLSREQRRKRAQQATVSIEYSRE